MTQYLVVRNTISENVKLDTDHKCHKIRKSSGKISYKITKDLDNLSLQIENIAANQRVNTDETEVDTVTDRFDLNSILNELQPNTVAGSATKLLPSLTNNNDAAFVTAVLINLGLVRIK